MKIILLITAVIGAACGVLQTLPEGINQALQTPGAQYLGTVITQQNQAFTAALEAFKPINASCMASYGEALASCGSCVNEKCVARAKSACAPSDWEIILGQSLNFVTKDVPDFFTDTVPDFFEDKVGGAFIDLGGEIVDITKDVGDFFEKDVGGAFVDLGGEIEDAATDVGQFFENAGGEIVGVVNDIGDAFEDLGDGIVDVATGVGKELENVGSKIGDGVGDAIDAVGDVFENIFGRKKRSLYRARRSTEPSCSAIKDDATTACKFYLSAAYCSDCGFSTAQDCPGYDQAVENVQAASDNRAWMSKATTSSYRIVKTQFDTINLDSTGQAFNDVAVEVHIFGADLTFTVSQAINPYIPDTAGPIIAAQALDLFKST